jgi:hypothetical protein
MASARALPPFKPPLRPSAAIPEFFREITIHHAHSSG